jgi:hypothetical protein
LNNTIEPSRTCGSTLKEKGEPAPFRVGSPLSFFYEPHPL